MITKNNSVCTQRHNMQTDESADTKTEPETRNIWFGKHINTCIPKKSCLAFSVTHKHHESQTSRITHTLTTVE